MAVMRKQDWSPERLSLGVLEQGIARLQCDVRIAKGAYLCGAPTIAAEGVSGATVGSTRTVGALA